MFIFTDQGPTEFLNKKLDRIQDIFKNVTGMPLTLEFKYNSTVDAHCKFFTQNSSLNKQVAQQLLDSLLTPLSEAFIGEDYKAKALYNLPIDLSMLLIFPGYVRLSEEKKYQHLNFIKNLIELSNRTYEQQSPSIGIIYCPNKNSIKNIKSYKNWEYIPLNKEYGLIELFDTFKPSIKLFDNKSLSLVLNTNFKAIGILRKNRNQKSISSTLEEKYLKNNKDQYLYHLTSFINEFTKSKTKKEVANNLYERIADSTTDIKEITKVLKYIGDFNQISPATIEKLKNIQHNNLPKFTFITLGKNEVNFHTKKNFVVSYNKGNWKIKHFTLLLAYIFEFLVPSQELFLYKFKINDETELLKYYTDILDNIQRLIKHVKALSDNNQGALIVILNQNNKNKISERNGDNCIGDFLEVQTNNTENVSTIITTLNNKETMNLSHIDYYLFQSIASIDGAVILDKNFNILAYGQIIKKSKNKPSTSDEAKNTFGARTVAAIEASYSGLAIKVSEDGDISIFNEGKGVFTL